MLDAENLFDNTLYIDSLSFSRGGKNIITNLYLTCGPNDVVGIVGRNGSGKSTLMNIIFGQTKPDFAFMRCNGVKFEKGYQTKEIVYLPQGGFLPRELLLSEALRFFEIDDPDLLELPFIQQNFKNRLSSLSLGMIRFFETLLILHTKHSFSLLDEPFIGLSPIYIDLIKEHIQLVKHRKGILISDHYFRQVMDISDRLYLLKDSRLIQVFSEDDLVFGGYLNHID
ncbi:MAG: ATP-binding cassette domain-containing protein [Sphingobacterium sp.]|jgi:ABC-type multidrug transport system ATPase subunit|uniref:ATP-binding cassette domain-containing protein n=1 Tax=Sphingobacterium sp. TaxID=341027 RepID=UPI00284C9D97|nr:ATP-binding cassette domain-containing protein [Sphingobacterium sp.]MDR3008010.1 ATP-binding cassette domain-containing protein [Sphingobacterium sp.]